MLFHNARVVVYKRRKMPSIFTLIFILCKMHVKKSVFPLKSGNTISVQHVLPAFFDLTFLDARTKVFSFIKVHALSLLSFNAWN